MCIVPHITVVINIRMAELLIQTYSWLGSKIKCLFIEISLRIQRIPWIIFTLTAVTQWILSALVVPSPKHRPHSINIRYCIRLLGYQQNSYERASSYSGGGRWRRWWCRPSLYWRLQVWGSLWQQSLKLICFSSPRHGQWWRWWGWNLYSNKTFWKGK